MYYKLTPQLGIVASRTRGDGETAAPLRTRDSVYACALAS